LKLVIYVQDCSRMLVDMLAKWPSYALYYVYVAIIKWNSVLCRWSVCWI